MIDPKPAIAMAVLCGGLLSLAFPTAANARPGDYRACRRLADVSLAGARLISVAEVSAGEFAPALRASEPSNLRDRMATMPTFCRIEMLATPTPSSSIGIEIWLPLKNWNGRLLGVGNGGTAGSISYAMGMVEGLKRGFAVATTDMGTSPDISEAAGSPERWTDFGHRATHEMTRVAKAMVRDFYKVSRFRSYFEGCSTGGQQALVTAQRYPEDYDGILAGAPGNNRTHSASYFLWNYQAVNATPRSKLTPASWSMVTRGVIAACAGKDGGAPGDRFLTDPRRCEFDPASLARCRPGDPQDQCLTEPQVATVRRLYAGPVNPKTGERIYPGLTPGSEDLPLGPSRFSEPNILTRLFVMHWGLGDSFDPMKFDFDRDLDRIDARLASTLNANSSDLNAFARHGGKLIIYTGLADAGVPFPDVVSYYDRAVATSAASGGAQFARLFLVPGMGHCVGGPGFTEIGQPSASQIPSDREGDALMSLVAWSEGGMPPDTLIARRTAGPNVVAQERAICAYPALPQFLGGDPGKRASFACTRRHTGSRQEPSARYLN